MSETEHSGELLRDGFPGQRMRVLPRPLVTEALRGPVTSQLLVTDVGFFPHASRHGRERPRGSAENLVVVCASGGGTCTLPSGAYTIRAGQVLVIPARVAHRYQADAEDPWTIWWMHLVGSYVPELLRVVGATPERPVLAVSDPAPVMSLIDTVIRRMEQDETMPSLLAASGAAWHALTLIAAGRRVVGKEAGDPIAATIEHLRSNPAARVSIAELAGIAGFSESHFAALFRRTTGYGALEYQTRLRMGSARELLDITDRSVSSIAQQVGYQDPLYFSRQFRRIHGMSPSEYRSHDKG